MGQDGSATADAVSSFWNSLSPANRVPSSPKYGGLGCASCLKFNVPEAACPMTKLRQLRPKTPTLFSTFSIGFRYSSARSFLSSCNLAQLAAAKMSHVVHIAARHLVQPDRAVQSKAAMPVQQA